MHVLNDPIYAKLKEMRSTSNPEINQLRVMAIIQCFFPRSKVSEKPNEALQSERRNGQRLHKVILNLGKLFRHFAVCLVKRAVVISHIHREPSHKS